MAVTLPNTPKLSFPVTQTYSDGTVVHWDEPPLPGTHPEHPTPTLTLASRPPIPSDHTTPTPGPGFTACKATARGLAGAGLLVGVIAMGVWLAARRSV